MQFAVLEGASLKKARMQIGDLTGAHLKCAVLDDAQLHGAVLMKADIEKAKFRRAQLHGADLRGTTNAHDAVFDSAIAWRAQHNDDDKELCRKLIFRRYYYDVDDTKTALDLDDGKKVIAAATRNASPGLEKAIRRELAFLSAREPSAERCAPMFLLNWSWQHSNQD